MLEKETPVSRSVIVERDIAHPPEKVWRALTEGALLEDWLMANDFQPVVGHRFRFRSPPSPHWDGIVEGEVRTVEPPGRLAYSWSSSGVETEVVWTLTETAAGTRLRLEQSGFAEDQVRNIAGAEYGWRRNLDNLERMLEGVAA